MTELKKPKRFGQIIEAYKKFSKEKKEEIRKRGMQSVPVAFVTFEVTKKQWQEWYSKNTYFFMGVIDKFVRVGASVSQRNLVGAGAEKFTLMSDMELQNYQSWCEGRHIYPQPMEKV